METNTKNTESSNHKSGSYGPNKANNISSNSKNNIMKKTYFIAGGITLILLIIIGGVIYNNQNNKKHTDNLSEVINENSDLSRQLVERDSLINDWVATFSQIESDLMLIKEKERLLEVKSSDDVEFSIDRKKEIIEDIKLINSLIEMNKKKINSLNSRLKESGIKIASLEMKVKELETSINSRDSSINVFKEGLAQKDFEIAGLNGKMENLETDIQQKDVFIDMQMKELNKAYLAYGTYKELKEKGVLTKNGGFLWIGKEKALMENFKERNFAEINILEMKTIPVHSKSAELITIHPKGSYNFVKDSTEMIAYLEIKEPMEFWKVSKYAVLETKN